MKHRLFSLLRLLAGLSAVAVVLGCDKDDDKPLGDGHDFGSNDPNLVIAVGDSITRGLGVAASQAYPAVLSGLIGKTVRNLGSDGARVVISTDAIVGALSRYQAGFVVILFGANDVITGGDTESIISALRTIVVTAKGRNTIPVLMTLTPMSGNHELWAATASNLNGRIRQLAGETGAALVDLESAFDGAETYLQEDGLHPNATGQAVIAAALADLF